LTKFLIITKRCRPEFSRSACEKSLDTMWPTVEQSLKIEYSKSIHFNSTFLITNLRTSNKKIERNSTVAISFQVSHEKTKTNKHHDMNVLES